MRKVYCQILLKLKYTAAVEASAYSVIDLNPAAFPVCAFKRVRKVFSNKLRLIKSCNSTILYYLTSLSQLC